MKIHPVFHVNLLKPYRTRAQLGDKYSTYPGPTVFPDPEKLYEIDKILDHTDHGKGRSRYRSYLTKWVGYPDPTDEPEDSLCVTIGGFTRISEYYEGLGTAPPLSFQKRSEQDYLPCRENTDG